MRDIYAIVKDLKQALIDNAFKMFPTESDANAVTAIINEADAALAKATIATSPTQARAGSPSRTITVADDSTQALLNLADAAVAWRVANKAGTADADHVRILNESVDVLIQHESRRLRPGPSAVPCGSLETH